MKNRLFVLLLVLFVLHLFFRIFSFKENYFVKYDEKYWQERYKKSQWVVFNSREPIGDDGLYANAGWEYVHGKNPILNSPDVPPLGKYLIGFSILLFKNQNIFALIIGIVTLLVFYIHNVIIFKNRFLAFLPVFLFSLEPIFYQQLKAPYLDLLQLSFLLITFIFLYKENFYLSSVFLGCLAATKNPYLSCIVISVVLIFLFQKERKRIFIYFLSLPLALLVFTLSYVRFFWLGNSIIDFLKVQKWIFLNGYVMAAKAKFGIVIPMIFSGFWFTWWDGILRVEEWSITWPVVFGVGLFFVSKRIHKKFPEKQMYFVTLWSFIYIFFLLFIPVFPRYLLLLLPFMYNLFIWGFSKSTVLRSFAE